MPGNRAIFDRALEQSREAARLNRWEDALKGAVRALREFPQDIDARTTAAIALFHTNKLPQALQLLEELHTAEPDNAFFLQYLARTRERQGAADTAADAYARLADIHRDQRQQRQEIESLRELLRLSPDQDEPRQRLARLLEETKALRDAANEYLYLARRFQERGMLDEAAMNAERALQLVPDSREARDILDVLREAMSAAAQAPSAGARIASGSLPSSRIGGTGYLRSQQFTLEKMIALAIEKQEAGDANGAIEQYEQAIGAGMERSDVYYSLGLLYQERGDHRDAVQMLNRAVIDPEYALSAHFALGESYKALNQLPQAAQELEQTIRLVDITSIGRTESDDLIQMYESAASIYEQIGDIGRAASLYSTLASFLQTKRWGKDQAATFKQRAKELSERDMFSKLRTLGTGALVPQSPEEEVAPTAEPASETWGKIRPITDFLRADRKGVIDKDDEAQPSLRSGSDPLDVLESLPSPEKPVLAPVKKLDTDGLDEQTARWVVLCEKYLEQNLLEAALDACHEVIRLDIEYLPIHLHMGEIYERQGRLEEALTKYQLLIDTYQIRGEPEKAIDSYLRFIELSPDTINARTRLAELLRSVGRGGEAVEQLAHVAAAYSRMGQDNKALEEYRRLIQWGPQNAELHTQYGQALLKIERYEAALGEFRTALELSDPEDPAAIARLSITLALMNEQPAAVWDSLESVLERIKASPQANSAVQAEYRAALFMSDAAILHYILGVIQQYSQQHSSALLEFEQAQALLEQDPDPPIPLGLAYQAMAESNIALENPTEALNLLRRAREIADRAPAPSNIKQHFARPLSQGELMHRMAEAYAANDDLVGAEQALLEARQLLPYNRVVYTKLADIYFQQGKLQEALAQLEDLSAYYEKRQDLDHAIEILEYGIKLAPSNISIGGRLARLQLRRGYLDQGVEGLQRLSELQRKSGQLKGAVASLQEVAQVYWMLSDHEKAREIYNRILQIAPDDVEARQWLALMHTLAMRTNDAIDEKKEIVRIFAQQHDYEGAIAELHQIIGMNQQDIEAHYMLGDMLMQREEYGQAVQLYNRMLNMESVEADRVQSLLVAANRMLQQQKMTRSQS